MCASHVISPLNMRGAHVTMGDVCPQKKFQITTETGLLNGVEYIPSPNCDEREGTDIDLIVVHNISLPPNEFGGTGILELFTNQLDPCAHPYYETIHMLRVSAHILVRRTGDVVQFVPFHKRAWHAGVSCYAGRDKCNDFSIGIELEGCDGEPFEPIQYAMLNALLDALRTAYPHLQNIVGHSDIAPERKTDPGPFFDWSMLRHD